MSTTAVSPLKIEKTVQRGGEYEETVTVRNAGDERTSYDVRTDEAYRAWVDPDANHFAINAGEARDTILQLRVPNDAKRGKHDFNVSVVNDNNPDDTALINVVLNVPIPVLWWILIAVVIIVLIVIIVALLGQIQSPGNGTLTPIPETEVPTGLLWQWGQVLLA